MQIFVANLLVEVNRIVLIYSSSDSSEGKMKGKKTDSSAGKGKGKNNSKGKRGGNMDDCCL